MKIKHKKENIMTKAERLCLYEFIAACGENWIDPGIALENPDVRQALKKKDIEKVKIVLREQF